MKYLSILFALIFNAVCLSAKDLRGFHLGNSLTRNIPVERLSSSFLCTP